MHSKQEVTPSVIVDHVRCRIVLRISLVYLLANYKSRGKGNRRNLFSISSTTSHSDFLPQPLKNLPHALAFLKALLQPASANYTRCKASWSLTALFTYQWLILCNARHFPLCAASENNFKCNLTSDYSWAPATVALDAAVTRTDGDFHHGWLQWWSRPEPCSSWVLYCKHLNNVQNTKVLCVCQIQEASSQRPCFLELLLTGILGWGVKKAVWKRNQSVERGIAFFLWNAVIYALLSLQSTHSISRFINEQLFVTSGCLEKCPHVSDIS